MDEQAADADADMAEMRPAAASAAMAAAEERERRSGRAYTVFAGESLRMRGDIFGESFFLGGGSSRWREARWKEAGKVCEKKRREQKKPEKQKLDLFFFYPRCCCCCSFSESRPGQSRRLCSLVYTAR